MPVKKYRVYCDTEAKDVTGWSETEPATCFNNDTHTIDAGKTVVVDVAPTDVVRIDQSPKLTDTASYYLSTETYTVAPNTETHLPIVLDIDVNMFAVQIHARQENIGDHWSAYINKDTVIGVVGETVIGTVITMAPASVAVVKVGYYVSIGGDYIRVVDKTPTTLTLKQSVDATAGDVVTLTYFLVYRKRVVSVGHELLGSSIFGSFKIPKEYTAGILYANNSNQTKRISFDVEVTF